MKLAIESGTLIIRELAVFQRLVHHLKQHSLLGVHGLCLLPGDAEEFWVKETKILIQEISRSRIALQIVSQVRPTGGGETCCALVGTIWMIELINSESVRGDLALKILLLENVLPKLG